MDKNKLNVLHAIDYTIKRTCATCNYAEFPNNNWGLCHLHRYQHEKHTGELRDLSINKLGYCKSYTHDHRLVMLNVSVPWEEFLEET